ncbi:MAG: FtsH protease activity modulator HflK [Phycisphaerae bacterium]|nr:FtsH protease activity modulator HflK [Phycisphaerae bacterium]
MHVRDIQNLDDLVWFIRSIPVRYIKIGAAVVLAVVLIWGSVYTVGTEEEAVILRFGRFASIEEPGLHWKLPLGIDAAIPVKVGRVHKLEFGFRTSGVSETGRSEFKEVPKEAQMLTGDENAANVEWIVQYKIKGSRDYLFNIQNPEETIYDVSRAAMALVVGDSSVTEVLTERRSEIALEVKTRLQKALDGFGAGIDIVAVELENVTPPKKVRDSFNNVNRARQEMETTVNQANRVLMRTIPEVEGEAKKMLQTAEGYRIKRVNEAQGDVARFKKLLGEYARAKEITRTRLYLEVIAEVLPRLKHIYVVDQKHGGPLQVLDLEKALRSAAPIRPLPAPKTASTLRKESGL